MQWVARRYREMWRGTRNPSTLSAMPAAQSQQTSSTTSDPDKLSVGVPPHREPSRRQPPRPAGATKARPAAREPEMVKNAKRELMHQRPVRQIVRGDDDDDVSAIDFFLNAIGVPMQYEARRASRRPRACAPPRLHAIAVPRPRGHTRTTKAILSHTRRQPTARAASAPLAQLPPLWAKKEKPLSDYGISISVRLLLQYQLEVCAPRHNESHTRRPPAPPFTAPAAAVSARGAPAPHASLSSPRYAALVQTVLISGPRPLPMSAIDH